MVSNKLYILLTLFIHVQQSRVIVLAVCVCMSVFLFVHLSLSVLLFICPPVHVLANILTLHATSGAMSNMNIFSATSNSPETAPFSNYGR